MGYLCCAYFLVILAIKQADRYPTNPCELMKEYFGEETYPEWEQHKELEKKVAEMKEDIARMTQENKDIVVQIEEEKERIRIEEEEKAREEEEEANKKGGKKVKGKKR